MKLSAYAKQLGISYKSAWNWFSQGKIKGYQTQTGTIIVTENDSANKIPDKIAIYSRVSSHSMKENLKRQSERLNDFCAAKGWKIDFAVSEIGSGLNDTRPKFIKLLNDSSISKIIVENKDRATRFGFNYIQSLLKLQGREIVVINNSTTDNEDLLKDLTSVIYSFCTRLYGKRRAVNKVNKIKQEIND